MRSRWLRVTLIVVLGGALLTLVGCTSRVKWKALKQKIRSEFPSVEQVGVDELHRRLESGGRAPVLLDVREPEEYDVSHLEGARRVQPGGDLDELLADLPRDTPIVTYCSVGYRSSDFARRLEEAGFENVENLEGSIFEWANRGYPVVRDGEPVGAVHPYDTTWGKLLDRSLWPEGFGD